MKIVFQINGGIGKSIAATAVCKAIKKQYPKSELTVITGYPDVFAANPNVDRILSSNELTYFYLNHIENKPETKFFLHDPYFETDFIHLRGHLIKVWCEMNGIKYNGELPELFISTKEKKDFAGMFQSPKPILAIQTTGGMPNESSGYSWPRDIPPVIAQKVVDAFADDYNVVHIRRQDQSPLERTFPVQANFRPLAVLIMMSKKRLFIDSFAQHTAAALGLPSVVCWIANSPSQFGYEIHTNLIANSPTLKPDLRNSILSRYSITGPAAQFPYNTEEEIFDTDTIIAAVRNEQHEAIKTNKTK